MTTLQELYLIKYTNEMLKAKTIGEATNAMYAAGEAAFNIRTSKDVKLPVKPKYELVFTSKGVYRKKII